LQGLNSERNIRPVRARSAYPQEAKMKRALAWMCLCLALVPAAAYAQASITGVVKDTSGAVLPGVTVEIASPVLIEKVRTTVTDGSGA
jgi:hypothetical protein